MCAIWLLGTTAPLAFLMSLGLASAGGFAVLSMFCCGCASAVVLRAACCVLREAGKCSEPLSTWRGNPSTACLVAVIRQTARGLVVVAWLLSCECTCTQGRWSSSRRMHLHETNGLGG